MAKVAFYVCYTLLCFRFNEAQLIDNAIKHSDKHPNQKHNNKNQYSL